MSEELLVTMELKLVTEALEGLELTELSGLLRKLEVLDIVVALGESALCRKLDIWLATREIGVK